MFYKIKSYLCMRKKDFMNTKSPFIMITKHQKQLFDGANGIKP